MEIFFVENMQLMEDVTEEYDIESSVRTEIKININIEVTLQLLDNIKNSKQVHDKSKDIIVALVKQQHAMEKTFINKMDRDFKDKSEETNGFIAAMIKTVDKILEKMRI